MHLLSQSQALQSTQRFNFNLPLIHSWDTIWTTRDINVLRQIGKFSFQEMSYTMNIFFLLSKTIKNLILVPHILFPFPRIFLHLSYLLYVNCLSPSTSLSFVLVVIPSNGSHQVLSQSLDRSSLHVKPNLIDIVTPMIDVDHSIVPLDPTCAYIK